MKKVFLVAPSYHEKKELILHSIDYLSQYFKVYYRDDIFKKWYNFAGKEERRINELNEAIQSDADIIWAVRGGYGASQIINSIDFNSKKKKIFIGFSDFTMIGYIATLFGHKFIYGPMPKTFNSQKMGLNILIKMLLREEKHTRAYQIGEKGKYEGFAKVFCLTLLINLLGTKYEPAFENHDILFLEDVDEKAYAIDRYMMHLKNSGKIKNIMAIFLNFKNLRGINQIPLEEHLKKSLQKPIFYSLKFGHTKKFVPIIFGQKVRIDNEKIYFFDNLFN